jgi:mono/diheme cytochrome c family protein
MLGVGREAGLGGPIQAAKMFDVGGVKVGVVGVSDPRDARGLAPDGVTLPDAGEIVARVKAEVGALQQQGARILVVTAAMQRGAALRIADAVGALHLLVVGHAMSNGPANTSQPPPELIGSTLVVETANHAQALGVVDIHLRGGDGPVVLADADGVQKAAKIAELSQQILALEARINSWEKGGTVDPKDLAARKSDLARLSQERSALERPSPAPEGSHFRYRVEEVREGLGSDATVTERMKAFYKRVNEHNKTAFADLKPLAPTEGEARYVGADGCSDCHSAAREVWDKTGHARAYATLEKDFKEYNLECVSCHVTGYGKPGGSTVTHVSSLKDVQCETCHGPGSKHIEQPEDASRIIKTPDPKTCVEQCHHPPHVDGFDPVAKMDLVLGPGHGKPQ